MRHYYSPFKRIIKLANKNIKQGKEESNIVKKKNKRVMITMDERLLNACEKYLEKVQEAGVNNLETKSQLIEQALLMYFDTLRQMNENTNEGGIN